MSACDLSVCLSVCLSVFELAGRQPILTDRPKRRQARADSPSVACLPAYAAATAADFFASLACAAKCLCCSVALERWLVALSSRVEFFLLNPRIRKADNLTLVWTRPGKRCSRNVLGGTCLPQTESKTSTRKVLVLAWARRAYVDSVSHPYSITHPLLFARCSGHT